MRTSDSTIKPAKLRKVRVRGGKTLLVPAGITRIESGSTVGWQVTVSGTRFFADGAAGHKKSLEAATIELLARLAAKPIHFPCHEKEGKKTPAGISGPVLITRRKGKSRNPYYEFKVILPRFGQTRQMTTVYISTVNNFCKEVEKAAFDECLRRRKCAIEQWLRDARGAHQERIYAVSTYLAIYF